MSNSAAAAFSPAALSALRLAMRELPPSIERTSRWKQIAERVSAAADGTRTPRECYEKALALARANATRTSADAPRADTAVLMSDVHFEYERTPIVSDLSLRLARGRVVGLYGLSESGKTTVVRMLAGKLKPKRGKIEILADDAGDAGDAEQDLPPTAAPAQAAQSAVGLRRTVDAARVAARGALAAFTLSAAASPLQTAADVLRGAGPSAWLDRLGASAHAASKVAAAGVAGMLPQSTAGFIGACAVIALVTFVATAPLLVLTRALTMLCAPFRDAGETVTAARRAVADIERVERARRVEKARVARARAARVPKPLLMSSEDPPLSAADVERMSIYDAIARSMPSSLPIVVKEARAAALLRAGGLQLYDSEGKVAAGDAIIWINQREKLERCSGGQRHLVQMLSQLAKLSRDPDDANGSTTVSARGVLPPQPVLACDELLVSLDVPTQARMLIIVRELASSRRAAVLYATCMVEALELLCDELVFLHRGHVAERGPKRKLLDSPHSVAAREYIEAHKSIPSVGRTEAAVRQEMTKVREDVVEQLRIGLGDAPLPA